MLKSANKYLNSASQTSKPGERLEAWAKANLSQNAFTIAHKAGAIIFLAGF
ncbi:hypothetical protein [Campylobacter rectus]